MFRIAIGWEAQFSSKLPQATKVTRPVSYEVYLFRNRRSAIRGQTVFLGLLQGDDLMYDLVSTHCRTEEQFLSKLSVAWPDIGTTLSRRTWL